MTKQRKTVFFAACIALLISGIALSLTVGQYPLSLSAIFSGDETALNVFFTLRLPRTLMALLAGAGLSLTGYVYQTVFKNPIAAPDIIGVSSGACVGAGAAIVFFGGSAITTAIFSFVGGFAAVLSCIALAALSKEQRIATFVISGIAVNAVSQAILMLIKRVADPESQLAALEFWTMGSLSAVTRDKVYAILPLLVPAIIALFLMYRQITMLSLGSDEARMLGVSVTRVRTSILLIATLVVSAIVSVTGLITFVGLIAPHITRLTLGLHSRLTMLFACVLGSSLLLYADVAARLLNEVPISILTSLLGAPLLVALVVKGGRMK